MLLYKQNLFFNEQQNLNQYIKSAMKFSCNFLTYCFPVLSNSTLFRLICMKEYQEMEHPPEFTMDYKLPTSKMTDFMCLENFLYLKKKDTSFFHKRPVLHLPTLYHNIHSLNYIPEI